MNAASSLGKFLAAIAGKLDKSKLPAPTNEAEYYLNEIAQKDSDSGGGVFIIHTDIATLNRILDKTMGEIKEAWDRGDKIDIVQGDKHNVAIMLVDVHYEERAEPPGYIGSVGTINLDISNNTVDFLRFSVNEASEADALNAYPTLEDQE